MVSPALAALLLLGHGALWAQSATVAQVQELIAAGKLAEARRSLETLDASADAKTKLAGVIYFDSGDYAQAAVVLEGLSESARDDPESAEFLGRALFLSGRRPAAVPWLEKARAAGRNPTELTYMIGVGAIEARDASRARQAFAALYDLDPDSPEARLVTAKMMIRERFEESAEAELQAAAAARPDLPGVHYELGVIANFFARYEEAVAEFRKEIAVNPTHSGAYERLGETLIELQRPSEALPLLQKSVWLNPFSSTPYILLGRVYFHEKNYANAEGVLRRALRMDPQNHTAHYLLGQTLVRSGRAEEGREALKKAESLRGRP